MGVTYKLRDEVVSFIISQRQSNPLSSCRQLAESASQKFGLRLSKSSVHDVLKESGIITPRGRKPKDKFEIPQEKKKQIQDSLSQVKLLPNPAGPLQESIIASSGATISVIASEAKQSFPQKNDFETSPEYEGAGKIFLKAALWDLGIFSEDNIKEAQWNYYLTYSKGVKVNLKDNKSVFIDLPLPLERCIREVADGLINNIRPLVVHKVSDETLFKACMDAQTGFNIENISIVDCLDHILSEFCNIMEYKREYLLENRIFVENNEKNVLERSKSLFFSQVIDVNSVIDKVLNLKGFDNINKNESVVNLLLGENFDNISTLQSAVEKLNGMYIRDGQGRLVSVKMP